MLDRLIDLIATLVAKGFYGTLEIRFENGKVVVCKKTESIKL
jgi:hypothetical protein